MSSSPKRYVYLYLLMKAWLTLSNTSSQFPIEFSGTIMKITRVMRTAHGMLTFDAAEYDPKTTQAMKAWFGETSRKVYYAGPLIPQGKEDTSRDARANNIQKFLDEKLVSHGKQSTIYVRPYLQPTSAYPLSERISRVRFPSVLSSGPQTPKNFGRYWRCLWRGTSRSYVKL